MGEPNQPRSEQELAFGRLTWGRFGRAIRALATHGAAAPEQAQIPQPSDPNRDNP